MIARIGLLDPATRSGWSMPPPISLGAHHHQRLLGRAVILFALSTTGCGACLGSGPDLWHPDRHRQQLDAAAANPPGSSAKPQPLFGAGPSMLIVLAIVGGFGLGLGIIYGLIGPRDRTA
jgi:hypothetical protein